MIDMGLSLQKFRDIVSRKKKEKNHSNLWLFLIGIILATGSAYLLFATPLLTPAAESIIPKEDLVFFADIGNPDCSSALAQKAPQICQRRSAYLYKIFGVYPERLTLFSDSLAVAAYSTISSSSTPYLPALFLRIKQSRNAEEFIRNQPGSESAIEGIEDGIRYYQFSQPQMRTILFWRGWLIITQDKTLLQKLLLVKRGQIPSFSGSGQYQELRLHSDASAESFAYVHSEPILQLIPPQVSALFRPLVDFFPGLILTFSQDDSGVTFRVTARGKEGIVGQPDTLPLQIDTLTSFLPKEKLVFIAGLKNLRKEVEHVLGTLEESDPAFSLYVYGKIQSFLRGYFGSQISLEYDILPLLENEILFAFAEVDNELSPFVLVSVEDSEFVAEKKKKMLLAVEKVVSRFVPRVFTHTLEDGTEIREVAGCDDCVHIENATVAGTEITSIIAENSDGEKKSISVAQSPLFLVLAQQYSLVEQALENSVNSSASSDLLAHIPDIDEQKEFFVMRKELFSFLPPAVSAALVDFSTLSVSHSQDSNIWKFTVHGEY